MHMLFVFWHLAESVVWRTEAGVEEFRDCRDDFRLWVYDNTVWPAARCDHWCICEHHQWRRKSTAAAQV